MAEERSTEQLLQRLENSTINRSSGTTGLSVCESDCVFICARALIWICACAACPYTSGFWKVKPSVIIKAQQVTNMCPPLRERTERWKSQLNILNRSVIFGARHRISFITLWKATHLSKNGTNWQFHLWLKWAQNELLPCITISDSIQERKGIIWAVDIELCPIFFHIVHLWIWHSGSGE